MTTDEHRGPTFWLATVAGAGLVGFGLRYLWSAQAENLRSIATWFVGGALALDLVLVPLGAILASVLRRVVPDRAWPPVRSALLTTAVLVAFAYPLVTDRGGQPGNPTMRPRDYDRGLLVALITVWATAAAVVLATHVIRVRSGRDDGRRICADSAPTS